MTPSQFLCVAAAVLISCLFATRPSSAGQTVDLQLVLAVDVSHSMDNHELKLQRDGYIAAFRHPEIHAAIRAGRHGRIALAYVEWAGRDLQFLRVPWQLIDSAESAEAFAARLERLPVVNASRTSLSGAIRFAHSLFRTSGYDSLRRAIDISGDGPNNSGGNVEAARDEAVGEGTVINGLPLMLRPSYLSGFADAFELNDFYRDCVIGGVGSFLVTVEKLSELTVAIRRKLILEIAGRTSLVMRATHRRGHPKVDCLIGEKLQLDVP